MDLTKCKNFQRALKIIKEDMKDCAETYYNPGEICSVKEMIDMYDEYMSLFSVVFQDYRLFQFSIVCYYLLMCYYYYPMNPYFFLPSSLTLKNASEDLSHWHLLLPKVSIFTLNTTYSQQKRTHIRI